MFIVKAVQADGDYSLFECTSVVVRESRVNGANGPGQPPFVAPDEEVWLYTGQDCPADRILNVGPGLDHYWHVYVMNERGKTVDTVSFKGPLPITSAEYTGPVRRVG